jgi:hypothetical protein
MRKNAKKMQKMRKIAKKCKKNKKIDLNLASLRSENYPSEAKRKFEAKINKKKRKKRSEIL